MRTPWAMGAWLLCMGLSGCDGCGRSEEPATEGAGPGDEGTAGDEAHHEPGPPPEVTVEAHAPELADPDERIPVVRSRGREPARLAREAVVERRDDGTWREVATLKLRQACDAPAEGCVTLVPGAELRPPPWLGQRGRAQCECTECEPAPAGRYRFVVRSCDGVYTVPGEAFE
ncbi:MAG: hypothetical protein ACODAG_07020, partial [Myxococcota bacterium]